MTSRNVSFLGGAFGMDNRCPDASLDENAMIPVLSSRWFAPTLHALAFAATFGTVYLRSQPLLDGPAGVVVSLLLIADLPISLFAFSAMWDGKWLFGLLLWGIGGSMLWLLWGSVIRRVREAHKD
jgi:hypothetical protein